MHDSTPDPSAHDPSDQTTDPHLIALGYASGPWPALLADLAADHDRPDAVHGRVLRADRGAATVRTPGATRRIGWAPTEPPPVTGDWVLTDGEVLLGIAPRRTAITRPAHHRGFRTEEEGAGDQVLAANADLVGVVMPIEGDLHVRRLERGVVLAFEAGATPIVVLTKADLSADVDVAVRQATAAAPGVDVVVTSTADQRGIEQLRARLAPDQTMALLGASGGGKSTLTNALAAEEVLAVGHVRRGDAKGRHTTTHRELVVLPGGGAVLDTPGLRTLSVGQVGEGLQQAFPEVEELAVACRFSDCRHDGEPGCAVLAALDARTLDPDRLEGWRRIRTESENAALRADTSRYRKVSRSRGVVGREAMRLKQQVGELPPADRDRRGGRR